MSKYGYSLDVGDELEKELQEVESRISQYGKVGKGAKKEDSEEDPLFGGEDEEDIDDEKEERKRSDKKTKERKEEKHTKKIIPKIKVERSEKEKPEHPQKVRLQTYTVKKEQEKDKKERKEKRETQQATPNQTFTEKTPAQELIEQSEEGTDWVTGIVWIAVIILAGYFVWSYFQPIEKTTDVTQCAITTLSQNNITTLNVETEKNSDVRLLIRDALTTPNLNEARTYYAKATCGEEQNCTKNTAIMITPNSLTTMGITTPENCRKADDVIVCDNGLIVDGTTATIGNKAVHTVTIINKGKGTTATYAETALQSASVYEGKEGLQSITYPRELEGSTIIRMYTRETLEGTGYTITYESANPRIVGYTLN